MEVIWGQIFGHGLVKGPPIGLKHWRVKYWSNFLSFDMSPDIAYKKGIAVVIEIIWGHIFGHGKVKWPPIGLKHWKVEYCSHYLSFDVTWHWIRKVIAVVMEVIWGHIFGYGEVKLPSIGLKHWKVEYWSQYPSFDMLHNIGYKKVIAVVKVMEVIWGHNFGHGEVKWPPIGLKHWKVTGQPSIKTSWFYLIFKTYGQNNAYG